MKYKDQPLPEHRTVTLTLERGMDEHVVLQISPQEPCDEDKAQRLWPIPARPMRPVQNAAGQVLRDKKTNQVILEADGAKPVKYKLAEDRQMAHELWCMLRRDPNVSFETPFDLLEKDADKWADLIDSELNAAFTAGERLMIRAKGLEASGLMRANAMLEAAQKSFAQGDT